MSRITEDLDKRGAEYVIKQVVKPEGSGCRITGIPADWEGSRVIIIRERFDAAKAMSALSEEMSLLVSRCEGLRRSSADTGLTRCHIVSPEVWERKHRDNEVCAKCPFGKRIAEVGASIDHFFEMDPEELKKKLAAEYKEDAP